MITKRETLSRKTIFYTEKLIIQKKRERDLNLLDNLKVEHRFGENNENANITLDKKQCTEDTTFTF